jgi:hypothetical protein
VREVYWECRVVYANIIIGVGGIGVAFDGINGDEVNLELNLNEPRLEAPEGLSAPAAQGRPPILPSITPLFTGLFSPIRPVYLVLPVLG